MKALVIGDRSVIGSYLCKRLREDGWETRGVNRATELKDVITLRENWEWDFLLCCIGTLGPVGHWSRFNWHEAIYVNLLEPIKSVQEFWQKKSSAVKVCFLAGSNPNKAAPNYLGYNISKMALLKAVETMDAETPEATFFALGPGFVPTRFHLPTIQAALKDERLGTPGTPLEKIYDCLKWCLAQEKAVIGGRNIHVNDPWDTEPNELAARLALNPNLYKLRRIER